MGESGRRPSRGKFTSVRRVVLAGGSIMRYGDQHAALSNRLNALAGGSNYGKKIERPGWHPTARDDLNLSRCQCTALRSLAREGIAP